MDKIIEAMQTSGLLSVLGAVVIWAFFQFVSTRIKASVQHEYDSKLEKEKDKNRLDSEIKIERYRLEFNQILSEYQIQFGYWYTEKAKAINEFYIEISKMYSTMQKVLSREQVDECTKEKREEMKEKLSEQRKKYKEKWLQLKLFVNQKEEELIEDFTAEETKFFVRFIVNKEFDKREEFIKEGQTILEEMSAIIDNLQQQFQDSLQFQNRIITNVDKDKKE